MNQAKLSIKPGWGYYDITVYPYGGSFHRVPHGEGLPVNEVKEYPGVPHSYEGVTADNRRVVFDARSASNV